VDRLRRRKQKAFTLIELMIAIAIISVLAAIMIPRFASTRYRAYLSACELNVRNLGAALESYRNDQAHYPDQITDLVVTGGGGTINTLPICPSGSQVNYNYEVNAEGDNFTIICPGYHEFQIQGMLDGFPQYVPNGGVRIEP